MSLFFVVILQKNGRLFFSRPFLISGADGSRTRVRTRKQYAFYMLIFALIFERQQDRSHQLSPYLLKSYQQCTATTDQPRINSTSEPDRLGAMASERCLVSAPCAEIKLIYYTSIKQQERKKFRQL